MRQTALHLADIFAAAVSILLLAAGTLALTQTEAALPGPGMLSTDLLQPVLILCGFVLLTMPLTRRLAYQSLLNPGNVAECGDVRDA